MEALLDGCSGLSSASIPAASALMEDSLPLHLPQSAAISCFPSFKTHPQLMLASVTLPLDTATSSCDCVVLGVTSVMSSKSELLKNFLDRCLLLRN